jgi:uncharacterized protein
VLTDPVFLAVAIPAVIALGLSKGGFAGIGTIATPLIALVLPPFDAAALILPILIVQDVISIYVYRREWSAQNLKVMIPGAVAGIGLAWFLAAQLPEAVVRLIVGAIGLSFVLNVWLRPALEQSQPRSAVGVFWGAVSGFTSAFANAGGPPFQIYILPQRLPKLTLVGTSTLFFAAVNWLKVIPYLSLGNFSRQGLMLSLALMPLAILANFAGIWLVRATPTETFYKIAYALIFVLSLALIWQGGSALWRTGW